jgi:LacI family transcriptional regulator
MGNSGIPSTINSIARAAGVSSMTVSRVLSGQFRYKRRGASTRAEQIRRLAEEAGYRPNAAARAVVRGRFHAVTAVVSADRTFRSNLNPHLLLGLTSALEARRLHLSLTAAHDSQLADPDYVPHTLTEHCADGLLVLVNIGVAPRMAELITRTRLPVVWVNDKREFDAVYPDDLGAGQMAAELLLAAGHRRLAYVDYVTSEEDVDQHYSRADRRTGFTAAVQAAGLELLALPASIRDPHYDRQRAAWREWLQQPGRPTAVAAYSAPRLLALFSAMESLDLRVPDDLSVVVFNDDPVRFPHPLTTLIVPHEAVGRAAVAMLGKHLDGKSAPQPSESIPFTMGTMQSIAAPKRSNTP